MPSPPPWSRGGAVHVPISAARPHQLVFRGLYTAREKAPPTDTDVAPEIQSQKVPYKLHKPISQFLPPHLIPTWDRLRTREVVAAFWALPNDVHTLLQAVRLRRQNSSRLSSASLLGPAPSASRGTSRRPRSPALLPWSARACGPLTSYGLPRQGATSPRPSRVPVCISCIHPGVSALPLPRRSHSRDF